MVVDANKVIAISYQLFSLGEHQEPILIEERSVDDPLEFIYGEGVLLPKVEESIHGQGRGYQSEVHLEPQDAFGLHNPQLQVWLEKSVFPKEMDLKLGMKFQTQGPDGNLISVIVKELNDDKVLIDGNHPLAGLKVKFEVKVLRVREASEEELATKKVNPTVLH